MNPIPTVVVHGLLTHSATNFPVHAMLRRRGQTSFDVPIPGLNTQDIAASSEVVRERVNDVLRRTGAPRVNLVGVSLGGVIAAHYVRLLEGHAYVRRTVALGSPFGGVKLAGLAARLPLRLTAAEQIAPGSALIRALHAAADTPADIVSVYADGDAVVPREAAHLSGARNVRAPIGTYPLAHYQLVVDPRNLAFLADVLLDEN